MNRPRKRSPGYPRISLDRAVELIRRVHDSAFDSETDTQTVLELMGYQGRSGPSTGALSSLKHYGLIEGRAQSVRVTPLAARILHPADDREKLEALLESVGSPQLYAEIALHFSGKIPSDQVLKSYLVRNHGFNPNGANEFLRVLRDNRPYLEPTSPADFARADLPSARSGSPPVEVPLAPDRKGLVGDAQSEQEDGEEPKEMLRFRVSPTCVVRILFLGKVSRPAVERAIQYLELAKDQYPDQ